MNKTKIQWTESTLNLITGCTKVSSGCRYCYAERIFPRIYPNRNFNDLVFHPERMKKARSWNKPKKIFINSLSDTFHKDVPEDYIIQIMQMIRETPQHTYQILTKRIERAKSFFDHYEAPANLRLGTSVENNQTATERLPILEQTKVHSNFVSIEPLLSSVELMPYRNALDWVIIGGESGPNARPMDILWATDIVKDCKTFKIPVFMKQLGTYMAKELELKDPKGGDPEEWPPVLRVREYPNEGKTQRDLFPSLEPKEEI